MMYTPIQDPYGNGKDRFYPGLDAGFFCNTEKHFPTEEACEIYMLTKYKIWLERELKMTAKKLREVDKSA